MTIYEYSTKCYRCNKTIKNYTYLIYRELEIDVTFPINSQLLKLAYTEMPSHKDNPIFDEASLELNYPVKVLGQDPHLDNIVMKSGKFPNIKLANSKTAHTSYVANHCPHCNSFLGRYHLLEYITDNHLRNDYPLKFFCELTI